MCYEEGLLRRWSTKRVRERAEHADRLNERPTPGTRPEPNARPEPKKTESEKPRVPERELEPV